MGFDRTRALLLITIVTSVLILDIYNTQSILSNGESILRNATELIYVNSVVTHAILLTIVIILLSREKVYVQTNGSLVTIKDESH